MKKGNKAYQIKFNHLLQISVGKSFFSHSMSIENDSEFTRKILLHVHLIEK